MAIYVELHQLEVHQNNKLWQQVVLVSDDYGADRKWRSNLEMGGGFGWGIKLSGFGATKN